MRHSVKPVRKCHSCLLNLGKCCWIYKYPRGQWRNRSRCPASDNKDLHRQFREWQKQPTVKSRKELRREFFRTRKRTALHHVSPGDRRQH